jgi:hypothetical protein
LKAVSIASLTLSVITASGAYSARSDGRAALEVSGLVKIVRCTTGRSSFSISLKSLSFITPKISILFLFRKWLFKYDASERTPWGLWAPSMMTSGLRVFLTTSSLPGHRTNESPFLTAYSFTANPFPPRSSTVQRASAALKS